MATHAFKYVDTSRGSPLALACRSLDKVSVACREVNYAEQVGTGLRTGAPRQGQS